MSINCCSRIEEVTIVSLILILWVCAIVLFVHRWGKIRMLVPAQPRYAYEAAAKAEKIKVGNKFFARRRFCPRRKRD